MILKDFFAKPDENPYDLINIRDGAYAADLLFAAIGHFDFFTRLDGKNISIDEICTLLNIKKRPADVLLTYCKSLGLLTEYNSHFSLTKKAKEFLTADSNWSLVPYFKTQAERPIAQKMINALLTDKPQSWGGKKEEPDWERAMQRDDFAETFTSGMDSRGACFATAIPEAFDFKKYTSVLDVAGASGIYAAAIKKKFSHLKAALLERPPVDKIAGISLQKRGMDKDILVEAGDMFEDELPAGYDIHLYSHVVHDWNEEQNSILFKKSYNSLNSKGILMIHDAHLNEDKTGPLSVAEYSVLLMFSTYGKCYSVTEIKSLMHVAGFTNVKQIKTAGNRSLVIGEKSD